MDNSLIHRIISDFKSYSNPVLLVENNDGFLFREDVIQLFEKSAVKIVIGGSINQRVAFELKNPNEILVLLSDDKSNYLEDIKQKSTAFEFFIKDYISGFHVPTILDESLVILELLYASNQIMTLSKKQTRDAIEVLKKEDDHKLKSKFDLEAFSKNISTALDYDEIDWVHLLKLVSEALLVAIGTEHFEHVMKEIEAVNAVFQSKIENDFQATKNSSYVKKPQIVSKILNYIDFNFAKDKVALIIVDGLSHWQYQLLSKKLPGIIKEDVIYSWIPSITQLSRQAIFRGSTPNIEYRQGPINEEKLWRNFWKSKGFNELQIRYNHQIMNLENLTNVKRFALVYKDLDDYMHSSKDYNDLLKLTENWIERSEIITTINKLLDNKFKIFITTDHGNIQAKGWRNLLGREKLGTNKSGSRSQRHLEYSDKWLSDEFMSKNPDLKDALVMEDQAIYFKNTLSFSKEESLVTHGGAHVLEVLIPFIEITNE